MVRRGGAGNATALKDSGGTGFAILCDPLLVSAPPAHILARIER